MKKKLGLMICLFLSTTSFAFDPVEIFFHNIAWLLKKVGSTQSSLLLTNVKRPEDIDVNGVSLVNFDKCHDLKNCQARIRELIEYHKIKNNSADQLIEMQKQHIDRQQEAINEQKQIIEQQEQSIDKQKQIIKTQQDNIKREIGKQKLAQGVATGAIGTACVATIGLVYFIFQS